MRLKQGCLEFKASLSCLRPCSQKSRVGVRFSDREHLPAMHKALGLKGKKNESVGQKAILWARCCLKALLSLRISLLGAFFLPLTATVPWIEEPLVLDLWELETGS